MTVLATAGHVDHGKSTFVNFLTGQETDRLKEEKIRGLTINLGYTYFEFKNKRISIVDVPGHVDYFKNTNCRICKCRRYNFLYRLCSGVV